MQALEVQHKHLSCQQFAVPLIDIGLSRGVHVDKLLKGTQLFYQDIIRQDVMISFTQLSRLIENTQKLITGDDVSFLYGRQAKHAVSPLLLQALNHSQSFAQQLHLSRRYQLLLCPMLYLEQMTQNDQHHYLFNFAIGIPGSQEQIFWYEYLACAILANFKQHLGYCPTITIKFPYAKPSYFEQYQTHIAVKCEFDFPFFMVSMPKALTRTVFIESSVTRKRFALSQLRHKPVPQYPGFTQVILQLIQQNMQLNLDDVAAQLHMSPATLKRKLKLHRTQFSELKDQVRQQRAIFAMLEQGYSNEKVAEALQFSDLTNFRRTFKRWTGMTPSQLRAQFGC
jgi:AraC-like DNA-binding protein